MHHHEFRISLTGLGALAALALSAGCVFMPPPPETVQTPVPVTAEAPPPEPEPAAAAAPAPAPVAPRPAAPTRKLRTAIVLSDDIPAFTVVAEAIAQRLDEGTVSIHNLDGFEINAARVSAEISEADRVVAVGLLAATVGRRHPDKPMVFCKVFNYQDFDLISASSKGVSFLPPFELQLDAWTQIAPGLMSIGIITGPGQEALVDEIRKATDKRQIGLAVRTVESDKEALVSFKRLTPEVQGLWLLPDNRVLSPEVVREIMSYSAKHRKQIVVFGSNLLGLGALMSVTSDDRDVAEQVLNRLDQLSADGRVPGPDLTPLTEMNIEINAEVARHLGLSVSEQVARFREPR